MHDFDVVIVGAGFSGLSLAHHLPKNMKILIVDSKTAEGQTVESTGLITSHTRDILGSFFNIDDYITNPISSICVMSPDYSHFVSHSEDPWIFQTDTKALIHALRGSLPSNVSVSMGTVFTGVDDPQFPKVVLLRRGNEEYSVRTKFLAGADGGKSKVAAIIHGLDKNRKFLFGYEQVFHGDVHPGPNPEKTIYHFWFGAFSLGYGGWLSPTIFNGKRAFRVGLAKLSKDTNRAGVLTEQFVKILLEKGIISIDGDPKKPVFAFGNNIPIGGVMKNIHSNNVLLIGDAAGFCGAFAADGIKGAVLSGIEAAPLIVRYLRGETGALKNLKNNINRHNHLIKYYKKQLRYRLLWNMMKSDSSFDRLYRIIEKEKEGFLHQFCDSKDKRRSLIRTVLKPKHLAALTLYGLNIIYDQVPKKNAHSGN